MECNKCENLLSDFLDGTLTGEDRELFGKHLDDCLSCAGVRDEMHSIMEVARGCSEECVAPPDSRSMWLRIRNTIELELEADRLLSAPAAAPRPAATARGERESFWGRLLNKRWELSLPQLTAAVFALVVCVSVATALGLQQGSQIMTAGQAGAGLGGSNALTSRSPHSDPAADAIYHQAYVQQQQVRINYWQQHIEQRKASWNPQMRDAFERSMQVIDEAVNESLSELKRDPHDEVSAEMLNAALNDKMELMREFSEQ